MIFLHKKITKLADMNHKRSYAGICIDNFMHQKIYVGCGYHSKNTFECYDALQNKWISLSI